MAISFGMNAQQAQAANAAMSGGTTFTSFHIFIMSTTAFLLVAFILSCLIVGYNHLFENEISLEKFVKLIIVLAVLFVLFDVFLII